MEEDKKIRLGDTGYTKLATGETVHKFNMAVEVVGLLDEVKAFMQDSKLASRLSPNDCDVVINYSLQKLQEQFNEVIEYFVKFEGDSERFKSFVDNIEVEINELTSDMKTGKNKEIDEFQEFEYSRVAVKLNILRTVWRRMERSVSILNETNNTKIDENIMAFINRGSYYIFTMAAYAETFVFG